MPKIERRFVPADGIECRKDADGTHITGYGAVYYRADNPGTQFEMWPGVFERIMPGAFDRAIKEDDVRGLFNHDPNQVLGRTPKTMKLTADKGGMRYDISAPDTQLGRDIPVLLERGDINGSSFAFEVTDEEWRKEDGVEIREIQGVKLYDTGPVTYPAYKGTSAGIRAEGELTEARASYEAWKAAEQRDDGNSVTLKAKVVVTDDGGNVVAETDTTETRTAASDEGKIEFPMKEARRRRLARLDDAMKSKVRARLEGDISERVRDNAARLHARESEAIGTIESVAESYRDIDALKPIFEAIARIRKERNTEV